MSLDQNLFTLSIRESTESPGDTDLFDPTAASLVYRRHDSQSSRSAPYHWSLVDPLYGATLATVTADGAIAKKKLVTLHDPEIPIVLEFTGKLSFKWEFTYEGHAFEWRKDACFLLRKPDPPVQVAVYDAPRKDRPASVQILDYNIKRFDIEDRKGLEIVLLSSLLTFNDYTEGYHVRTSEQSSSVPATSTTTESTKSSAGAGSSGIKLSATDPNDIVVHGEGTVDEYATHCAQLLADKDLLFIIIRAGGPEFVPKVVQIAQETKRVRQKLFEEADDLHQYVRYDDGNGSSGVKDGRTKQRRVIKLDEQEPAAKDSKSYQPLTTLTVYLSKINMPDFEQPSSPALTNPSRPFLDGPIRSAPNLLGTSSSSSATSSSAQSRSSKPGRATDKQKQTEYLQPPVDLIASQKKPNTLRRPVSSQGLAFTGDAGLKAQKAGKRPVSVLVSPPHSSSDEAQSHTASPHGSPTGASAPQSRFGGLSRLFARSQT